MKNSQTKKITRVCAFANQHMLLQYLLLSSEEEIAETFYFLDRSDIGGDCCDRLSNSTVTAYRELSSIRKVLFYVRFFFLRYLKYWLYPFLKDAEVFSADHTFWGYFLTFDRPYELLEDGFTLYRHPLFDLKTYLPKYRYFIFKLIFHPYPSGCWGKNPRCQRIHLTDALPAESELDRSKVVTSSFLQLWEKASPARRKIILDVFGLSDEDFRIFDGADALIMTQPLSEEKLVSETEKIEVYRRLIAEYQLKNVVFKPHPREKTDYLKHFPEARCFRKKCPVELLALLDLPIKTVATLFSSGIIAFKGTKYQVIWAGNTLFEREIEVLKDIKKSL